MRATRSRCCLSASALRRGVPQRACTQLLRRTAWCRHAWNHWPPAAAVLHVLLVSLLHLQMWDVGGQKKIRMLWHHYFRGSHALIFVVDSNDRERFDEGASTRVVAVVAVAAVGRAAAPAARCSLPAARSTSVHAACTHPPACCPPRLQRVRS